MMVRLSTAYTTISHVRAFIAGTTATAPNASQTSRDTSAPVSSTNGINGSPRLLARRSEREPASNAAMNPLPPSATADA